tara:strand:+ start:3558 stop:5324 length:1767 start_codon:yes stop_codon:yes gene_type:complete
MCGVFGILGDQANKIHNIYSPSTSISSRGPDSFGKLIHKNLFLYHTRLAIRGNSNDAYQPCTSLKSNFIFLFNGEIYDYNSFKYSISILKSRGDVYSLSHSLSSSDPIETINSLNGMYSLAIYDKTMKKIYITRDIYGEKPLFYSLFEGNLIFSSCIQDIRKQINKFNYDKISISNYFCCSFFNEDNTPYTDIKKLLPGETLIFKFDENKNKTTFLSKFKKKSYFNNFINISENTSHLTDVVDKLFNKSVRKQMVSDVNLGCMLSGGVDSSLVASVASKYNSEIITFNTGFKNKTFDESNDAKKVSKMIGVRCISKSMDEHDALDVAKSAFQNFNMPVGDLSVLPTIFTAQLAKDNGIKVLLGGDGADELFLGYKRHWLPRIMLNKNFNLPDFILSTVNKTYNVRLKRLLNLLFDYNYTYYDYMSKTSLFKHSNICNKNSFDNVLSYIKTYDLNEYLPNMVLAKLDNSLMSNGIEGRSPYLDWNLSNYCLSRNLGETFKYTSKKYILNKVLKRYLPNYNFNKVKKGFTPPFKDWLNGNLKEFIYEGINHCLNRQILTEGLSLNESLMNDHEFLWSSSFLGHWLNYNEE